MSHVNTFLEHHNPLVIGDEATGHYQLVLVATDDVWETLPSPAKEEDVNAALSNIGLGLPTGRHSVRLQAISEKSASIRGQLMLTIEGRSVAARKSNEDSISHAKALSMNIATAEQQLATMGARLQESEERARQAEERAGMMILDQYKMADMVHRLIREKEDLQYGDAERQARIESFKMIAETLTPILGQAVIIASKWFEVKMAEWEKEWSKQKAEATTPTPEPTPPSPASTHETEHQETPAPPKKPSRKKTSKKTTKKSTPPPEGGTIDTEGESL